jgi:hypothetical protein
MASRPAPGIGRHHDQGEQDRQGTPEHGHATDRRRPAGAGTVPREGGKEPVIRGWRPRSGDGVLVSSLASTGPNGAVRSSPAVANGRLYVTAGNLFAFALK